MISNYLIIIGSDEALLILCIQSTGKSNAYLSYKLIIFIILLDQHLHHKLHRELHSLRCVTAAIPRTLNIHFLSCYVAIVDSGVDLELQTRMLAMSHLNYSYIFERHHLMKFRLQLIRSFPKIHLQ